MTHSRMQGATLPKHGPGGSPGRKKRTCTPPAGRFREGKLACADAERIGAELGDLDRGGRPDAGSAGDPHQPLPARPLRLCPRREGCAAGGNGSSGA